MGGGGVHSVAFSTPVIYSMRRHYAMKTVQQTFVCNLMQCASPLMWPLLLMGWRWIPSLYLLCAWTETKCSLAGGRGGWRMDWVTQLAWTTPACCWRSCPSTRTSRLTLGTHRPRWGLEIQMNSLACGGRCSFNRTKTATSLALSTVMSVVAVPWVQTCNSAVTSTSPALSLL